VFATCGLRIGVRLNAHGLLERLLPHLPPLRKPSTSVKVERLYSIRAGGPAHRNIRPYNILYVDSEQFEKSHSLDDIFDILSGDLDMYVAENARRRLFIHAGVVGWRGRAILFPGRSMSGKSALVKKFVDAGADYYSDEYAVLDFRGMVHPYCRPISLRSVLGGPPHRTFSAPQSAARPLPIGLIALSCYAPGGKWRPRKLSHGRGVLALLENSMSARRQPQVALSILSRLTAQVPVLKGIRGEAGEMINALLNSPFLA
jgi:hypothetical protein